MKLRIFIVDDEECIRDTFQWYLEDQGHEVIAVAEPLLCDVYMGHDCQSDYPCGDLLLTDFNMPKMNGLELIDLMAKRGCKCPPLNKIIMTGDATVVDSEKAQRLGCQIEQKPLSLDRLDEIVLHAQEYIDPARQLADLSLKMK